MVSLPKRKACRHFVNIPHSSLLFLCPIDYLVSTSSILVESPKVIDCVELAAVARRNPSHRASRKTTLSIGSVIGSFRSRRFVSKSLPNRAQFLWPGNGGRNSPAPRAPSPFFLGTIKFISCIPIATNVKYTQETRHNNIVKFDWTYLLPEGRPRRQEDIEGDWMVKTAS
jgi:hypothetical protein